MTCSNSAAALSPGRPKGHVPNSVLKKWLLFTNFNLNFNLHIQPWLSPVVQWSVLKGETELIKAMLKERQRVDPTTEEWQQYHRHTSSDANWHHDLSSASVKYCEHRWSWILSNKWMNLVNKADETHVVRYTSTKVHSRKYLKIKYSWPNH